nr:dockerin type I repeat-containing protein [Ruminococcus difficilis]
MILGDADGDGEISAIDMAQIMRYVAHIDTGVDEEVLMNADVDGNGELEIVDATYIQRYLSRMETPYAIGEAI